MNMSVVYHTNILSEGLVGYEFLFAHNCGQLAESATHKNSQPTRLFPLLAKERVRMRNIHIDTAIHFL
jgi:hypothetical protein